MDARNFREIKMPLKAQGQYCDFLQNMIKYFYYIRSEDFICP